MGINIHGKDLLMKIRAFIVVESSLHRLGGGDNGLDLSVHVSKIHFRKII